MLPLVAAIFFASVLGSLHCAGMCGAFLGIALGDGASRWTTQAAYHLGRLVTYVTLGIAAGAVGHVVNLAGALAGIKPLAMGLSGAMMLIFGVVSLLRISGVQLPRLGAPPLFRSLVSHGFRLTAGRAVTLRAAMIGLLTTLLPCGWLYAFVGTAAGTGSALNGAMAMAVFWTGTLPVMVALGTSVRGAAGLFGRYAPVLTCLVMMALGLLTLAGRTNMQPETLLRGLDHSTRAGNPVPNASETPECCRSEGVDQ